MKSSDINIDKAHTYFIEEGLLIDTGEEIFLAPGVDQTVCDVYVEELTNQRLYPEEKKAIYLEHNNFEIIPYDTRS